MSIEVIVLVNCDANWGIIVPVLLDAIHLPFWA